MLNVPHILIKFSIRNHKGYAIKENFANPKAKPFNFDNLNGNTFRTTKFIKIETRFNKINIPTNYMINATIR